MRRRCVAAILLGVCAAGGGGVCAQNAIVVDYSLDVTGKFSSPAARQVLEEAGHVFADRIVDPLTGIMPGVVGGVTNTWDAVFPDPGTGNLTSQKDLTIAGNTIVIYVGGYDLPAGVLGRGGPGGFSGSGTMQFVQNLRTRGQAGAGGAAA